MKNYTMFEIERLVPNFFSKGAKRFFNSKINMQQFAKYGFFITSEKYDENAKREYTIRFFRKSSNNNYSIDSASEFQEFSSLGNATKELNKIIKIIDSIISTGGFLEKEIINKCHYITKENDLYCLYAYVDENEEEEKSLKLDTKNNKYTF